MIEHHLLDVAMKTLDPLAGISAFLAVARSLSFTRAAEDIGLSRATVGTQLQALEKRLGVRLLQRTTRAVSLTEAGTAYRDALSGLVAQIYEAERAAKSFQEDAIGRIRISAPLDFGIMHLAPAVADFLIANPGIAIELDYSYATVNLVEEGFDLAIRGTISVEPNIVTRQIGASPIVVCASPEYLAMRGKPEEPGDLSAHDCLHFSELRWGRIWHFRRGDDEVRIPIVPRLEVNDGTTLRDAAVKGGGVTLLPMILVGQALREGRLTQILPSWSIATVPLHAVYPANRHIAHKVRAFVSFLAERVAGHPDLTAG